MKITELSLKGVLLIEAPVFPDLRGTFTETYNKKSFKDTPLEGVTFVQDNLSYSHKGVFRGMHAQHPPYGQAKYLRAVSGRLLDIVLDITPSSPTYGQALAVELSPQNNRALYIPKHYAHGFLALEEETRLYYKVDSFYVPKSEIIVNHSEPSVKALIEPYFTKDSLIISEKDAAAPLLAEIK